MPQLRLSSSNKKNLEAMWWFEFATWFETKLRGRKPRKPATRSSKGEREVERILQKHDICFEPQYPIGCIHVDFAVTHNGQLHFIEYDGRQHYHPVKHFGGWRTFFIQRMRDLSEKWECKDRGIPLLRIRYDLPMHQIESTILEFLKIEEA